jgi:serine phosphatase RsbU (regulator of sigma subunit)
MPGMDGISLLKKIYLYYPEIDFILITGNESISSAIKGIKYKMFDYILKPFGLPELNLTIEKIFEKRRLKNEIIKNQKKLKKINLQLSNNLSIIKRDLEAGKKFQNNLLPKTDFKISDYTFSLKLFPSLYLSGDFLDYFSINNNYFCFYFADVSGHGITSAFVTFYLKNFINQCLLKYKIKNDPLIFQPADLVKQLNDRIVDDNLENYLTLFYAVVNQQTNQMKFCSAGCYPFPTILSKNKVFFIEKIDYPIGILKEAYFSEDILELPDEFSMLMLSDGVFELPVLKKIEEVESKENFLLNLINYDRDIKLDDIIEKLRLYNNKNNLNDDITLFLMQKNK